MCSTHRTPDHPNKNNRNHHGHSQGTLHKQEHENPIYQHYSKQPDLESQRVWLSCEQREDRQAGGASEAGLHKVAPVR